MLHRLSVTIKSSSENEDTTELFECMVNSDYIHSIDPSGSADSKRHFLCIRMSHQKIIFWYSDLNKMMEYYIKLFVNLNNFDGSLITFEADSYEVMPLYDNN